MRRSIALAALAISATAVAQAPRLGVKPPKLVVLVSIDQFRADFVDRFAPHYLPAKSGRKLGGFRFLSERGANYVDAHHNHVPTATGPGHATLLTGSEPFLNGIVGNDWFDRATGKEVYCVEDPAVKTIGGTSKPMSPFNLKVTTVGDELKMATNGRSKVVGIAFKDRAAILMAGHAADTVIWYDAGTGNWVTSSFYAPNGTLPAWVTKLNDEKIPAATDGKAWEPLLPKEAYALSRRAPAEAAAANGLPFQHVVKSGTGKTKFDSFSRSSFGQDYVFQTVERALDAEALGTHDVPDMLVVNLATNDYIGHQYGPNSPEVLDLSVRTDRLLSNLFNSLDRRLGIENVTIVVTADHGVVPIPEETASAFRSPGLRVPESLVVDNVNAAMVKAYGPGQYVLGNALYAPNLYLDHALIEKAGAKVEDAQRIAAAAASQTKGVYTALPGIQLMLGLVHDSPWLNRVMNGFDAKLCGDVMVFEGPGNYFGGGTGTGHGSPWSYDSHVPILLAGHGIKPGSYGRTVTTADIASTLCRLIGIEFPTGNVGHPLAEAIK